MEELIPRELLPFLDPDGRLRALPSRHRKKLLALWYLAGTLPAGGTAVLPGLFFLGLCRPGGAEFRFAAGGAYQGGIRNIGAAFGAIAHGAHLLSFVNPLPKAGSEKV